MSKNKDQVGKSQPQSNEVPTIKITPELVQSLKAENVAWLELIVKRMLSLKAKPGAMEVLRRIVKDELRQPLQDADRELVVEACNIVQALGDVLETEKHISTARDYLNSDKTPPASAA